MDHKNLQTFIITKQLNQRQVYQAKFLSQFNFVITYRPNTKATIPDALSRLLGIAPTNAGNKRLRHRDRVVLLLKKVNPAILDKLLSKSQDQSIKDFIAVINLEPKKKPLKELIKNAYKENKLAKDILAALREQEGHKARHQPKQIRKSLRYNKSKCLIINGLIYYRNQVFVPDLPKLLLEVIYRTHSLGPIGHLGRVKTLDLLSQTY